MITHIFGKLEHTDSNEITVDVDGVGYRIFVSPATISSLPKVGEPVKIFTFLNVKEDAMHLYGFKTKDERGLFKTLLSVSGIGPKGAMSIVSAFPVNQLVAAIAKGNADFISAVQGIGKKTAQKLVVELKEKIAKIYGVAAAADSQGMFTEDPSLKDAVSALMTLGYSPKEAKDAIGKVDAKILEAKNIELIIKHALKSL